MEKAAEQTARKIEDRMIPDISAYMRQVSYDLYSQAHKLTPEQLQDANAAAIRYLKSIAVSGSVDEGYIFDQIPLLPYFLATIGNGAGLNNQVQNAFHAWKSKNKPPVAVDPVPAEIMATIPDVTIDRFEAAQKFITPHYSTELARQVTTDILTGKGPEERQKFINQIGEIIRKALVLDMSGFRSQYDVHHAFKLREKRAIKAAQVIG